MSIIIQDAQNRNFDIDFVKGFLVFGMLVIHVAPAFSMLDYIKSLSFVTASYIMLSGYVFGNILYYKYTKYDKSNRLNRDIGRSLKIYFFLYLVPNITCYLFNYKNLQEISLGKYLYLLHLDPIIGVTVFEIIYPLAIFIFISSIISFCFSELDNQLYLAVALFVLGAIVFVFITHHYQRLVGFGFIGFGSGLLVGKMNVLAITRKIWKAILLIISFLTILFMIYVGRHSFFDYLIYVICNLTFLLIISGIISNKMATFYKYIVSVSEYSLFAYVMQVVFASILMTFLQHFASPLFNVMFYLFTCMALHVFIEYTNKLCQSISFPSANKVYRLVFR